VSGRGKKVEKIAKISDIFKKKVEFLLKFWPLLQFVVFFNQLHQLLRKFYLKNQATSKKNNNKKKVINLENFERNLLICGNPSNPSSSLHFAREGEDNLFPACLFFSFFFFL